MALQKDYPVKVGSMLFTMVDPNKGHEAAYNRWYERDHFYAGCMIGPWLFAGARWVAPNFLKDLRFPEPAQIAAPTVRAGSYVSTYWILQDHHQEHVDWASPQVHWLYSNDRGFAERTHVHTYLYTYDWTAYRDDDPVPVELAFHHRYDGMVSLAIEREPGVDAGEFDDWLRRGPLPQLFEGSPVASCASWSPIPREGANSPMTIPNNIADADRFRMHMYFLESDPGEVWDRFLKLSTEIEESGKARVVFASPWLPTDVGTDTYTDQLW